MDMSDAVNLPHELTLSQRKKLTMTGALEVVSFEETYVVLKTALGTLTVLGENLQLKQLNPEGGNVAVEGEISALQYEQSRSGGSWLRRMLG